MGAGPSLRFLALAALFKAAASIASLRRAVVEGLAENARRADVIDSIPPAAGGAGQPVVLGGRHRKSLAAHRVNVSKHRTNASKQATGAYTRFTGRARARGEHLEQWTDSGLAVTPNFPSWLLSTLLRPITAESYGRTLHEVVDLVPSRFVASPGNVQAARYLQERLEKLGFDVQCESMDSFLEENLILPDGGEVPKPAPGNIVAYMKGSDLAHETVLLGAHYDSVNWENTSAAAPGCDDNGSGVAAMLLVAEAVAAQMKISPPRRSVVLAAFQAEEEGLFGSKWFVQDALAKGSYGKLVAAVICDEVTFAGRADHLRQAIFETKGKAPANAVLMDTFAHSAKDDQDLGGFEVNYHGFGSDHVPFLDAGFPAILLIERDNEYVADSWGHSSKDNFTHVDFSFGAAMTRLATRAFLTLASPMTRRSTNATLAL